MFAAIVNAVAVVISSLIGLLIGNRLKDSTSNAVMSGLGICVMIIGVMSAVTTSNILIVIICMVIGTVIGDALKIEDKMNNAGEWLKNKVGKHAKGKFVEGFVTASLLFCIGSMAIMGSFDAGLRHDYTTIFAKTVIDAFSAICFAAGMGIGVAFSGLAILVYQGGLTLLAGLVEPFLSSQAITEMSAVGGILLIGTAINMLELKKDRVPVGNMLPAIVLPCIWFPIAALFQSL